MAGHLTIQLNSTSFLGMVLLLLLIVASALSLGLISNAEEDPSPEAARQARAQPHGAAGSISAGEATEEEASSMMDDQSKDQAGGEGPIRLPGPDLQRWQSLQGKRLNKRLPRASRGGSLEALALYFRSSIFARPGASPTVIGTARRGARIPVQRRVHGKGCKGRWYQLAGGGVVCTSEGFSVGRRLKMELFFSLPDQKKLLPYSYIKVVRPEAERMYSLPSPEEDAQILRARKGEGTMPDLVEKQMKGIYLLAIDGTVQDHERDFLRTVRGRYIRREDSEPRLTPSMYGEVLGERKLPLAFVYGEDRPLYSLEEGELKRIGIAEKHARFFPGRRVVHDERTFVMTEDGWLVERAHVRIAGTVDRPEDVSSSQQWINVDLGQQTLVAYEGDRPLFATLISSGKQGFEPPLGLFQVHKKFVTGTMNGPDPDEEWYEVEEVPWVMYYWESYALHGTYWHNDFGKPRSHGCTNLAPADAKWLFLWTAPAVPFGWHGVEERGVSIYFTR